MKYNLFTDKMKFLYILKILLFLISLNGYYGVVLTLIIDKNKNITSVNVNSLKKLSIFPNNLSNNKSFNFMNEKPITNTYNKSNYEMLKQYLNISQENLMTTFNSFKGDQRLVNKNKRSNYKIKHVGLNEINNNEQNIYSDIGGYKKAQDNATEVVYYIDEIDGMFPTKTDDFLNTAAFFVFLLTSLLLIISGTLRIFTKRPQYVLIATLLLGCILGAVAKKLDIQFISKVDDYIIQNTESSKIICILFIPMNILYRAITINVHEIKKCLGQIMLVSIFGFVFQVTVMTFLIKRIDPHLKDSFYWPAALLFGVFCAPSDPAAMSQLKTGHSKVLIPLLEGECLMTMCLAITAFRLTMHVVSTASVESSVADITLGLTVTCVVLILSGITIGAICGFIVRFIWLHAKGDALIEASITIGSSYCLYSVAMTSLWMSGVVSIVTMSIILQKGAILKQSTERIWTWVMYTLNVFLMFWVGLACTLSYLNHAKDRYHWEWGFAILLYFVTYIIRGFTFALLKPLLASMGYGMTWQEATVATVGGIKHGSLVLPLAFACRSLYEKEQHFFDSLVIVYVSVIFVLSFLINDTLFGPLVRLLQVEKVTLAKKGNMSRAVEYVLQTRQRALDTLKLDRTTADANWLIVANCTQLKHPYTAAIEVEDDTHGRPHKRRTSKEKNSNVKEQNLSLKDSTRPATVTNLYHEQLREANRRVLKVKRVLCTKQYENGYINNDVLRVLYSVIDTAADRRRAQTNLDDLKRYWAPKRYLLYLRMKMFSIFSVYNKLVLYFKPQNSIRAFFFTIVMWQHYELFMLTVILINLLSSGVELTIYKLELHDPFVISINNLSVIIYIADLMARVVAFKFKPCAKSHVFQLDFIVCVCSVVHILLYDALLLAPTSTLEHYAYNNNIYRAVNWSTGVAKSIRFIVYLYLVITQAGVTITACIEEMIDRQLLLGYEIGRAYLSVLEDLEKKYNQVMDDPEIIDTVRSREQRERYELIQELGFLQRDRPMLAITTKTRLAVLTIMREMIHSVNVLYDDGLLDKNEHELLMQSIDECYVLLSKVGMVQPCPPHVILRGVSWLMGEEKICDFLQSKAKLVSFNYEDEIIQRGEQPNGIFILLSGITKATYEPTMEAIENWRVFGQLPNCDFFVHLDFAELQEDIVVSGNVIGELGLFTTFPYEYTVTCTAGVQAYYFSNEVMQTALKINPTTGYNLEMRIWKTISIRTAMLIVSYVPHFHSWTKDRLRLHLQRGFVPTIDRLESISITDIIEDIFLIQGVIYDAKTGNKYIAPSYIPITIKLLLLSEPNREIKSHIDDNDKVPVRLFIVPAEGVQEWQVISSLTSRPGQPKRSGYLLPGRDDSLAGADDTSVKGLRRKIRPLSDLTESEDERPYGTRPARLSLVEEDDEIVVYVKKKNPNTKSF